MPSAARRTIVAAELGGSASRSASCRFPTETAAAAPGGVAQASYAGRPNVLGRINPGASPSLLLNGHVDVVPAEAALWSSDPFAPVRSDGWLTGRGAGDMKGGFALGTLAVAALRRVRPDALSGELSFLSVIEEECTGNGTLAACNAGVLADAVSCSSRPTWTCCSAASACCGWRSRSPGSPPTPRRRTARRTRSAASRRSCARWPRFEDEINEAADDPAFGGIARPYNVNVGTVTAGDWASSVPGRARLRVRVGFPGAWSPDEALERVRPPCWRRAQTTRGWPAARPWSARRASAPRAICCPPITGWPTRWPARTCRRTGAPPGRAPVGATTDARFYLNQFGVPALAYGPRARNIHAIDEAVELASIVTGAKALARFIAGFFARRPGARPGRSGTGPPGKEPAERAEAAGDRGAPATDHSAPYLAPITMQTAGERIAERIVTAIALGEFVPDQRLPTERDLAAMLEVSRTTVREALQRLQAAGYVTTKRGRGRRHLRPDRRGPGLRRHDPPHAGPGLGRADRDPRLPAAHRAGDRADRGRAARQPPTSGRSTRRSASTRRPPTATPPSWRITRCTRRSPGPGTTPGSSSSARASAARSAWASTPSRTRRSARSGAAAAPQLAEAVIAGEPDRAARLAASTSR